MQLVFYLFIYYIAYSSSLNHTSLRLFACKFISSLEFTQLVELRRVHLTLYNPCHWKDTIQQYNASFGTFSRVFRPILCDGTFFIFYILPSVLVDFIVLYLYIFIFFVYHSFPVWLGALSTVFLIKQGVSQIYSSFSIGCDFLFFFPHLLRELKLSYALIRVAIFSRRNERVELLQAKKP